MVHLYIDTLTYMAILIQLIVGELQLVKGDDLLHPLSTLGRGVRVDMDPWRTVGVCLARHHPAARVEGVPVALVIHGHKVHDQHVVLHGVQAKESHLEGGEHPPARLGHYHLRPQLIELLPQWLHLQLTQHIGQPGVERLLATASIVSTLTLRAVPDIIAVDILPLLLLSLLASLIEGVRSSAAPRSHQTS